MGRNDLLSDKEVAAILEVTPQHVHALTRRGLLRAYYPEGRTLNSPRLYRPDQVDAYRRARSEENSIDLPTTYNKALQAEVLTLMLERRVEQLESLLGLDVPKLPYGETGIRSLFSQVQEALESPPTAPLEIQRWTRVFLAVHPEVFELIERYVGHPRPWEPFENLGRVIRDGYPDEPTAEVRELHKLFAAACRTLRASIVVYITGRHGKNKALEELKDDSPLFLERVLRHLPR